MKKKMERSTGDLKFCLPYILYVSFVNTCNTGNVKEKYFVSLYLSFKLSSCLLSSKEE